MALTYDRTVNETIAAIATAMSPAGIGIIRVSGPEAADIVSSLYRNSRGEREMIGSWDPGRIRYGFIVRSVENRNPEDQSEPVKEEVLDEVLVSWFRAPHSYTTEDTVEINSHGGMLVMQRILQAVMEQGARLAEPGEFTKRAFFGGRIDLARAEAVMDLISAETEFARRSSMDQLSGKVSDKIREIRDKILFETAFIESALDDPDSYDLEGYPRRLDSVCEEVERQLSSLLSYAEEGRILKEGIRTVIAGRPNVGKSSLLNRLAGEERAIVTEVEGTTRDTLSESVRVGGILLLLTDTAGIRTSKDRVEQIGVFRARKAIEDAELILFLIDGARPMSEEDLEIAKLVCSRMAEGSRCLVLLSKSDLKQYTNKQTIVNIFSNIYKEMSLCGHKTAEIPKIISCSIITDEGIEELAHEIRELFDTGRIEERNEIFLSGARHREAVREARDSIRLVRESIRNGMSEEFYAIDLMNAYTSLGRILGESVEDDLVEEIFSKFCMGK